MTEILRTQRLLLRELTLDDTADLCAIMQDPLAMTAYERTFTTPQVEDWIRRNMRRYRCDGAGLWAAVRLEDGALVGQCGLVRQQLDGLDFWEVGYLFNRRFWHQGICHRGRPGLPRLCFCLPARAGCLQHYQAQQSALPAGGGAQRHEGLPQGVLWRAVGRSPALPL